MNNPSRIIFGQININSIMNKFQQLTYSVNNEIDILMVTETKQDYTFPTSNFLMPVHPTDDDVSVSVNRPNYVIIKHLSWDMATWMWHLAMHRGSELPMPVPLTVTFQVVVLGVAIVGDSSFYG